LFAKSIVITNCLLLIVLGVIILGLNYSVKILIKRVDSKVSNTWFHRY
jgi:hypothetical protein